MGVGWSQLASSLIVFQLISFLRRTLNAYLPLFSNWKQSRKQYLESNSTDYVRFHHSSGIIFLIIFFTITFTEVDVNVAFSNYVLQLSPGIEESGQLSWKLSLCLLAAWTVVFGVLIKGIKSLGKVRIQFPLTEEAVWLPGPCERQLKIVIKVFLEFPAPIVRLLTPRLYSPRRILFSDSFIVGQRSSIACPRYSFCR